MAVERLVQRVFLGVQLVGLFSAGLEVEGRRLLWRDPDRPGAGSCQELIEMRTGYQLAMEEHPRGENTSHMAVGCGGFWRVPTGAFVHRSGFPICLFGR